MYFSFDYFNNTFQNVISISLADFYAFLRNYLKIANIQNACNAKTRKIL